MTEVKISDGIYFTDFRNPGQPPENSCLESIKKTLEDLPKVLTIEEMEKMDDPLKLSYILFEKYRKIEWMNTSNEYMLEDKDLLQDEDVIDALRENVEIGKRNFEILDYLTARLKPYGNKELFVEDEKVEKQRKLFRQLCEQYEAEKSKNEPDSIFV